jgi:hypothetical protein
VIFVLGGVIPQKFAVILPVKVVFISFVKLKFLSFVKELISNIGVNLNLLEA